MTAAGPPATTSSSQACSADQPARSLNSDDQTTSSCAATGDRPSCRPSADRTRLPRQLPPQPMRLSWRRRMPRVFGTGESVVTGWSRHCCGPSRRSRTLGDLHHTSTSSTSRLLSSTKFLFTSILQDTNGIRAAKNCSHLSPNVLFSNMSRKTSG